MHPFLHEAAAACQHQMSSAPASHHLYLRCRQASVHLPVWRRLAQQAATGRLTVLEGWEVAAAEASQQQEGSSCQGEGSPTWQLTLKQRASETALPAAAAGPTTFQQAVAAASAAAAAAAPATPVQGSLAAADEAEASGPGGAPAAAREQPAELHVQAQLVWLACGAAYSAASEPVLAQLQRAAPVPLTGGYPWLDEENLCWPGAAAYVAGRGSMLSVGPCAGAWARACMCFGMAGVASACCAAFPLSIPQPTLVNFVCTRPARPCRRPAGHALRCRPHRRLSAQAGLFRGSRVGGRPATPAGPPAPAQPGRRRPRWLPSVGGQPGRRRRGRPCRAAGGGCGGGCGGAGGARGGPGGGGPRIRGAPAQGGFEFPPLLQLGRGCRRRGGSDGEEAGWG